MTKTAYFLALAGLLIGFCHLLPRSHTARLWTGWLLIIAGFVFGEGVLSGTIAALGLVATGPLQNVVQYLTDYDDDRPVILLVGSSFTQQGVDPDLLAETVSNSGYNVAVLSLAVGGMSHLERLHYLREYFARCKRIPSAVLFEIAGGYDDGPLVSAAANEVLRAHGCDDGRH